MGFIPRIGLIPRYNWDFRPRDLRIAFNSIFKLRSHTGEYLEKVFGENPIFTTSGRASLYSILRALNLREGSRVGVPLFCCPVVFDAISQAKLVPSFIDINLDDYNLSVNDLERKKESLSALVVVHMFGHPADMDSIRNACKDIPIVEDCAQSLFSVYKGHYIGFESTASFFSFRSGKYISAGEGSVIFCRDASFRESIERLVNGYEEWDTVGEIAHCVSTLIKSTMYHKPWYGTVGQPVGKLLDSKLNLTAKTGFRLKKMAKGDLGILEERIASFREKIKKQRENSFYFLKKIKLEGAILPYEKEGCQSNYYQFVIRFASPQKRDKVALHLYECGIDTAKYLDDLVEVVRDLYHYKGDCPNSEICAKTVLVLPNHYTLSSNELEHIVTCLREENC